MQFDRRQRRDFMALLGGAAAWPPGAIAQQTAISYMANSSAICPLRRKRRLWA
jgi:hypothetical protein